MANPSPKNRNQDLVLAMPDRILLLLLLFEVSAAQETKGNGDWKREKKPHSEAVLRSKCLLGRLGLVLVGLQGFRVLGGCGEKERISLAMAKRP